MLCGNHLNFVTIFIVHSAPLSLPLPPSPPTPPLPLIHYYVPQFCLPDTREEINANVTDAI